MPMMNPASTMAMQPELLAGESIFWADQPNPRVIFHKEDLGLIPFSLLWGGFAIFWEAGVAGFWGTSHNVSTPSIFMMMWGVPFILIGQYLIWGRFVYDAWLKRRTHYAVTNRRVIVLQNGYRRKVVSAYLDSLPAVSKDGPDGSPGTLSFTPASGMLSNFFAGGSAGSSRGGNRSFQAWNSMSVGDSPVFRDIDDLDAVYRLVCDLREKSRSAPRS
jgi:hypothetical protein